MNEELKDLNNDSINPILDIVNSIQEKLSSQDNTNNYSNINESNNKDSYTKNDLSGLDISKMLEMLNSSKNKNSPNPVNTSSSSGLNLDLNSIMNFQKIFNGTKQNDPRQNLLMSLKPFLRETRQKNIDTYITLLGVMKTFNIFNNKDRD